jgi:alpha-glucosidase
MKVWPNHTAFLDWFHASSAMIWGQGLYDLHNLTDYDGIWIDMNEATGFT